MQDTHANTESVSCNCPQHITDETFVNIYFLPFTENSSLFSVQHYFLIFDIYLTLHSSFIEYMKYVAT